MSAKHEQKVKEEVEEVGEVKHEPVVTSMDVPETATSPTAQEYKAQQIKEEAADEERAIENDPGVNPSPRRSARISKESSGSSQTSKSRSRTNPKKDALSLSTIHQRQRRSPLH